MPIWRPRDQAPRGKKAASHDGSLSPAVPVMNWKMMAVDAQLAGAMGTGGHQPGQNQNSSRYRRSTIS